MTNGMDLDDELSRATSALRWITLALSLGIIALIGQIITFILIFTGSRLVWPTGLVAGLLFLTSLYCRWMSRLSHPKSWRKTV